LTPSSLVPFFLKQRFDYHVDRTVNRGAGAGGAVGRTSTRRRFAGAAADFTPSLSANDRDALGMGNRGHVRLRENERCIRFAHLTIRAHVKDVQLVALREKSLGIGVLIDDVEVPAARIEGELEVARFARAGGGTRWGQWASQSEALDFHRVQGIGEREYAHGVTAGAGLVERSAVGPHPDPAGGPPLVGRGA